MCPAETFGLSGCLLITEAWRRRARSKMPGVILRLLASDVCLLVDLAFLRIASFVRCGSSVVGLWWLHAFRYSSGPIGCGSARDGQG